VSIRNFRRNLVTFWIWKRGVSPRGKGIKSLRGGVHQYAAVDKNAAPGL